ncbi:MAG: hypothetical protein ACFFD4_29935 [Candidatus Odinarchaeota archaeon]
MSGRKRELPPPPGKKKGIGAFFRRKPSIATPPIETAKVQPPKPPPAAPPGIVSESDQKSVKNLKPPVEPPPYINKEGAVKSPPFLTGSPTTEGREPSDKADMLSIPQDVAFQAAAKAKRTIPKPPPSSHHLDQITESESLIGGSLDDLIEEEIKSTDSPKVSLPKPTSYRAPQRPTIDEDELVTESYDQQEDSDENTGFSSAMPSLPDISKYTQKKGPEKKKRKFAEYSSIDYSGILRKSEEQPSSKMLVSEIKDVFQKGIKETLIKPQTEDLMDNYDEVERERYRRMFEDYEAAGKKFQEMQLTVNAAQSYAMALISAFLAGDVSAALWLLDDYEKKLSPIIREAEIYEVVKGLIGALRDKSFKKVALAEEIIENVTFLSFDDKQLIKKCIKTIKARIA